MCQFLTHPLFVAGILARKTAIRCRRAFVISCSTLHTGCVFNSGKFIGRFIKMANVCLENVVLAHSRSSRDNADDRMEIDFLIRKKVVTSRHNISPIEVKSSPQYSLSSLEKFGKKFANYLGKSFVLHTKDNFSKAKFALAG